MDRIRLSQMTIALLIAVVGMSYICFGQTGAPTSPKATLADLGFIAGRWSAEWQGGVGEEHWSVASGDSMVGTFRFVKDGKATFYEFMLIEATPEGPVLRLKHFNPGLIGWEEKAQVYSYPLVEFRSGIAVFERGDKKSRLIYRRMGEMLSVLLEQTKDDKRTSEEFKFKLVK